jgi:hypothetical protein
MNCLGYFVYAFASANAWIQTLNPGILQKTLENYKVCVLDIR